MKSRPSSNFKKRSPSGDRGRGSFGPKKEKRWGQSDRPFRTEGAKPERNFRSGPREGGQERRDRGFGGGFSDRRGRDERGPRTEGGPRTDRGPRRERPFGPGKGFRSARSDGPRPFSGDRKDRSDFRRPERDRDSRRPNDGPTPRSEGSFQEREKPFRPHLGEDEMRYLGVNSCLSVWKLRPKDVIRVYVQKDLSDRFGELLEFCAKTKKSYHLVSAGELEKLTDSKHHEGICIVAKEKRALRENDLFRLLDGSRQLILYLDGVGNPHNLGAILRSAAHFGVSFICGEKAELPRISPAAHRTSEGGAEHTSLVLVEEPERFFDRLKGLGFQIYAFDPNAKANSLFDSRISERSVFVMGAEVAGVSGLIHALADAKLKITGTGVVESLNVSVAAALAMAEFHRQGKQGSVRIVKKR